MKITKYHGKYNRSTRTQSVKYIVVHYTGSGSPSTGTAKANCIYFSGGNRNASAHYFIDNGSIYEYADPKQYYTWHCGDGHGKYGITNSNSIGIEVCQNGDKPYTAKEIEKLTWLVKKLMKEFNVPASRVVRHYDASRKMCPYYYAKRPDEWKKLRKTITGSSASKSTKVSAPKTTKFTKYQVIVDALNFRTKPSTSAPVNRVMKKGAKMNIAAIKNGWAQTKTGDWGRVKSLDGKSTYMKKM